MARYRYLYTYGKELQKDCPAQVNACELAQNRDKMIKYTCLAGIGDIQCLEIEKKVYSKPSDDQVWLMIKEQTGATSSTAFQQLADEIKCLKPLQ